MTHRSTLPHAHIATSHDVPALQRGLPIGLAALVLVLVLITVQKGAGIGLA